MAVLSMYDLIEVDEQILVEEALDQVRPYIESHGGGLELLEVDDGVVHVRLSGSCSGCAASAMTLRRGVEESLRENYENFKEVVAHEPEEAEAGNGAGGGGPQLLQIEGLDGPPSTEKLRKPVFEDVGTLDELKSGEMKSVDIDGTSVLIVNVQGEPYAFKNHCALEARLPLDGARLAGTALVCPWHNCAYDARSGHRIDSEDDAPSLAVVPVAVRDGVLKVAVNVA
jgi:Fe-S cluster biogenesis protein NfuA/nitrite reductase/ring-hydroxylating ferredoxin subunit